jgi:hypothetical protein
MDIGFYTGRRDAELPGVLQFFDFSLRARQSRTSYPSVKVRAIIVLWFGAGKSFPH